MNVVLHHHHHHHHHFLLSFVASRFCSQSAYKYTASQANNKRWLKCTPPDFGQAIGYLIPSKVPLSDAHNDVVVSGHRYTFKHVIQHLEFQSKELGLVIDLTNTDRYYNSKTDLKEKGIEHVKIACRGRKCVPNNEFVNWFVYEVSRFLAKLSHKYVLVHCTHGYNRTGYMIVHYLMRTMPITVTQALRIFAEVRPPGIYKHYYIDALYSFYHEKKPDVFCYPAIPEWKDHIDNGVSKSAPPAKVHEETVAVMKNGDILGDGIPLDQQEAFRRLCYSVLGLAGREARGYKQFPGSHPVSLSSDNLEYLREQYYYATWKADGTRYMMLITMDGCYLIDRHFNFRRVQMRFPCKRINGVSAERTHHHLTLLDGEMVIDTDPDSKRQARRYLIYDIMALNSESIVKIPFHDRWEMIEEEIIEPRNYERQHQSFNPYQYELEPFKVRRKHFFPLSTVPKILNEFVPGLCHDADGLIFQGWDDCYVPRANKRLLKWKYANMNSVDFLFEMEGCYHRFYLLERGKKKLIQQVVKFRDGCDPLELCGKIIECCWDCEEKCWVFMRMRPDKGTPNDINTYKKVVKCIEDNITEEKLLDKIEETVRVEMYGERIQKDIAKSKGEHPHKY